MLTLDLGTIEYYDSEKREFIYDVGGVVRFEYTLKAMYEWEGKWHKPFLKGELTEQELVDFYILMALDPIEEKYLSTDVTDALADYIKNTNTATTFTTHGDDNGGKGIQSKPKLYTSEELYALMFAAGIPVEFENRNLNRLMVILRIISSHNSPPKKMNKQDIMKQNASLNAQRKAQMKTKG